MFIIQLLLFVLPLGEYDTSSGFSSSLYKEPASAVWIRTVFPLLCLCPSQWITSLVIWFDLIWSDQIWIRILLSFLDKLDPLHYYLLFPLLSPSSPLICVSFHSWNPKTLSTEFLCAFYWWRVGWWLVPTSEPRFSLFGSFLLLSPISFELSSLPWPVATPDHQFSFASIDALIEVSLSLVV